MIDLEKVIEGLEHCDKYGYCTDKQCPYYENANCHELLRRDAFSLLSTQEKANSEALIPVEETFRRYKCGKCGNTVVLDDRFCRKCGKEIDWNGRN